MRCLLLCLALLPIATVAQEVAWESTNGPGYAEPTSLLTDAEGRALIGLREGTFVLRDGTWEQFSSARDILTVLDGTYFVAASDFLIPGSGQSPQNEYAGTALVQSQPDSETVSRFSTLERGWIEHAAASPDGDVWLGVQGYEGYNGDIGVPDGVRIAYVPNAELTTPSGTVAPLDMEVLAGASELHDLVWTSSGVFAATDAGLYAFFGASWGLAAFDGLPIISVAETGSTLLAGGDDGDVFRSTDGGATWTQASPLPNRVNDLHATDDAVLAAVEGQGIYRSADAGSTWTPTDLTSPASSVVGVLGGPYFATAFGATLYRSEDGISWTPRNFVDSVVEGLVAAPEGLIARSGVLYRLADGEWEQVSTLPASQFAVSPTTGAYYIARIYDQQDDEPGDYFSRVYRSTDAGASWTQIHDLVGAPTGLTVTTQGTVLLGVFSNTSGTRIERLQEGEETWVTTYTGGSFYVRVQQLPSSSIYAIGEFGYEISDDDGQTWGETSGPPFPASDFQSIAETSEGSLVISSCDGVFRSDDGGATWSESDLALSAHPLAQNSAGDLFAGVRRCAINAPLVGGVYRSTDDGRTWEPFGLDDTPLYSFHIDADGVLFAGTSRGVFRTDRTTVDAEETTAPQGFAIGSAYPNPFARSTTIALALDEPGRVTARVFDTLGRTVATLHAGPLTAGTHRLTWDAGHATSGTYFVRIVAASGSRTVPVTVAR